MSTVKVILCLHCGPGREIFEGYIVPRGEWEIYKNSDGDSELDKLASEAAEF